MKTFYLAPEANTVPRTINGQAEALVATFWRAETFFRRNKITALQDRIEHVLLAASDESLLWYMGKIEAAKREIASWEEFKFTYIAERGTQKDKQDALYHMYQGETDLKSYLKWAMMIAEKTTHTGKQKAWQILAGLKNTPERKQLLEKMHKKPREIKHMTWLKMMLSRLFKRKERSGSEQTSAGPKAAEGRAQAPATAKKADIAKESEQDKGESSVIASGKDDPIRKERENKAAAQTAPLRQNRITHALRKPQKTTISSVNDLYNMFPDATDNTIRKRAPCTACVCRIETPEGKVVCVPSQRRIAQSLLSGTKETLKKLEAAGVIQKSESKWRNPIRPVPKPDGSVRICTNLIALNEMVIKDQYPTPIMADIIGRTQGSNWFTVLDLKDGYFQIEIAPEDREKTAFKFENTQYEWQRMPMGFKNAPAIFQRMMDRILEPLIGRGVEVYLDDIVVHARDEAEHDKILYEVMGILEKSNLVVNMKKIQFKERKVKLLGMEIDGQKQMIAEDKKKAILDYPRPTDTKSLRRFLGVMNFYRDFIKDLARIAVPLYDKTGKYAEFEWTAEMEKAFVEIKEALAAETALYLPDYEREFILETDASDTGLGAVLMQRRDDGTHVPIKLASKKLTPTERRYAITEKEMFAVMWGISTFDYQLYGRKFHLITDHKALTSMKSKGDFGNPRINRWVEKIQGYDFTIEYRKGETVIGADALSRLYEEAKKKRTVEDYSEAKRWKDRMSMKDGKAYFRMNNGEEREMPDYDARRALAVQAHEDTLHRGVEATYYALNKRYYWPGMKAAITNVIKECRECNANNRKNDGGEEFVATAKPLEKTALDIVKFGEEDKYALVWIDYFTRTLRIRSLPNRTSKEIISKLTQIYEELGTPEELNTDNAKEFTSREFEIFCAERNVRHHLTSVEKHTSNGRVERVIRTIRDGMVKLGANMELDAKLSKIEQVYNGTYHSGIRMTPNEAWTDTTGTVAEANSREGIYKARFKKLKREEFAIGQQVRIAKIENLKEKGKANERFQEIGVIVEKCGNDSYVVKNREGILQKRNHSHLKGLEVI